MSLSDTYIRYGVRQEIAVHLANMRVSKTHCATTPIAQLVSKFGLSEAAAKEVKRCIKRAPIPADVVRRLLRANAFTCCCCHGTKRPTYIIHHIEHYEVGQDNSYDNLALLCTACHDAAHHSGQSLMLKPDEILQSKVFWESYIERRREYIAANGPAGIWQIDYLNIPRIDEFGRAVLNEPPPVVMPMRTVESDGSISYPRRPLISLAMYGGIRAQYQDYFQRAAQRVVWDRFDDWSSWPKGPKLGSYVRFSGYLEGDDRLEWPIETAPNPVRLHGEFYDKRILVDIDPYWIPTSTALGRMTEVSHLDLFGRVRGNRRNADGVREIRISPFLIGIPDVMEPQEPDLDAFVDGPEE